MTNVDQTRVNWLLTHQRIWAEWRDNTDAYDDFRMNHKISKRIMRGLKKAGLCSKDAWTTDLRIYELVRAARMKIEQN